MNPLLQKVHGFIGPAQLACIKDGLRGEEASFFNEKLLELGLIIDTMPKSYETDGQGENAIIQLHYFAGGRANFYITEKDKGAPDDTPEQFQSQAFGLTDIYGDGGALGYISIPQILSVGGELDMYWTPKSIRELRDKASSDGNELLTNGQRARLFAEEAAMLED